MPIIMRNPTVNQSPDPGQGGIAVTDIINTGHSSTLSQAVANAPEGFGSDSDSESRSARWSAFQSVSGQVVIIRLKFNWSADGSAVADDGGNGGTASASCSFSIAYSLNGGSNWINVASDSASAFAPGGSGDTIDNSGSADIVIPADTPIDQIQVRDLMNTSANANGGEFIGANSQADIAVSIDSIRLEVQTIDGHVYVIM